MIEKHIVLEDIDPVIFYGVNNVNMKMIQALYPKLKIVARGNVIKVLGDEEEMCAFEENILALEKHCAQYNSLKEEVILDIVKGRSPQIENTGDTIVFSVTGKPIVPRSENQLKLVQEYEKNDMLFAIGPAGSGKTYTAIALAVRSLKNKEIKKIILSRPAVEAGEKLGFLPGDMKDKISFNTIDTSTTGVKTVIYTGVDSAGNKSEVQLQVEVTFSGERIVNTGLSKTGCPYVWGSTGPNSFDCSGFTQWVYRQNGIYIPRTSSEQKAAAKKAIKASQKEFTKELADLADVYVNDAFGTAHRTHASTALMAEYFSPENKMFGYLMGKEVAAVDKVMKEMVRPFTAIMGGSKVSSKIDIIENLLTKVDNLIIAGGMTYTFTKALGGKIGNSICEDDKLDLALELINKAKANHVNLVLAVDAKIADDFSNDANTDFCDVDKIPDGWEGMDIGPKSEALFADVIKKSKTILWNGPTGVFEFDNFTSGSRAVAEAIVEATKNGAFSLVGGGDSVACVNKFGLADKVSYVSTGGGALLEAIEGKTLPGIAAIQG